MLNHVFGIERNSSEFFVMLLGTKELIKVDNEKTKLSEVVFTTGEVFTEFDKHFYKATEAIAILALDRKIEHIIS
jgi:hypothetical protein